MFSGQLFHTCAFADIKALQPERLITAAKTTQQLVPAEQKAR